MAEVAKVTFNHNMPAELSIWLDQEATRMGMARSALINMLCFQHKEKKELERRGPTHSPHVS